MEIPAFYNRLEAREIGRLNVRAKQCQNCLFGNSPLVSPERKQEIIEGCLKSDSHFNCHEFKNVCCQGFWHTHSKDVLTTRLALAFESVEFIRA